MKITEIKKIHELKGVMGNEKTVTAGWVKTIRDFKNLAFIELTDGTSFRSLQVVFDALLPNYAEISRLMAGSSIKVEGKIELTPNAKQPFEMKASKIEILGKTTEEYPLQKKRHSVEFLREIAYLRPRTTLFNAVFRVRSEASFAIHKFFKSKGFVLVHAPIITAADCEGGSDVFRVTTINPFKQSEKTPTPKEDFFGKQVFLTPTGQLEAEAFAHAFSKVYTFGPTFRAENSNTNRHASEFWMIEPEMAFCDLEENMCVIETMVKTIVQHLLDECPDEMNFFNNFIDKEIKNRLENITQNDFARVSYTDAISILEKNNKKFEFKAFWGCDLQSEHERFLCEQVFKKPVFVFDYPKEIKAFYMKLNKDGKTVRACDLLVPGIGEMVGGSQREEDHDVLLEKIKECGLNPNDYWWYLNLRKFGTVEHSGFGLGFERFLMYVTGIANIRDVQPFSRTPNNCDF